MPFVLNNITFYTIFIKWLVFISSVSQPLNGQSEYKQQTPLTVSESNPIKNIHFVCLILPWKLLQLN